ncbi:hypothetical protein [Pseudomonas sp. lyk4-R2A-8]|uniref:hypothetical protein n=1 Tax=Pseudomonas sp. lyk4-R2A-8 TaxID=3040316 RepID=UPI002552A749|nr:hypothetical protein [Pseudomonas sp. lyk4-R2A-8]
MAKPPSRKRPPSAQAVSVAPTPPSAGPASTNLPLPIIQFAANGNVLYPIDAVAGTTATLALPAGATHVMFYMEIMGQTEPVFEPVAVADGVNVVDISAQTISYCIGHTVQVRYEATVGSQVQKSFRLDLEVQQIREEDLRESLPVFAHVQYIHNDWVLDMATFSGDETIKVNAWPMIQAGQRLFINVAGDQHLPPFAFAWAARDHVVTAAEAIAGHVFEFKLSRAWMAQREDYSSLTVHMAVIFDGTAPVPAVPVDPIFETQLPKNALEFHPRTTARLLVDTTLHLPEPILVEAEGQSSIDPLKLLEGGTVRVCYEDMRGTDTISLSWASTSGDWAPIEPQNGVEEGCIDFHIPPLYVGMRLDNFALFSYTVTRDGEPYTSPLGQVRIKLPNFPKPQFLQSHGDKLDLSLLCCKDPDLYVAPWVFIGTTQLVYVAVTGTYADGSNARWVFFLDSPVTDEDVQQGWSRALPREELAKLKHGSELYTVFFVEFRPRKEGQPVYRMFPPLSLTVLTEPHLTLSAPELREAVNTGEAWVVNPVNTVDGAHMVVTYEGMCCGDTVCPTFSGTPGPGSPLLECRQPVEGESSLVFTVPPSAISANFEQDITLTYRVSRCDGSAWLSPPRTVEVLGISGLPKPVVMEATNGTLNLNHFTGDATATVDRWPYIALGQPCWLWVTGKLEDDTLYSFEVLEGVPVTSEWLTSGVYTPLPRLELEKLADCSDLEVHFAVNFNGQSDKHSATRFRRLELHVIQKELDLKAATVLEADGSDLTIWNGRFGVTVRVAYARMSRHQTISARWINPNGTILQLGSKSGDSDRGYVDFTAPREAVILGAGKTVLIDYTVTSDCQFAPSKTFALKISRPTRLPTPVVPQATGDILDLRTFDGDADITVEPWWFILPEQKVWLRGAGTHKDGSSYAFEVYLGKGVTAQELEDGLKDVLQRSELELLKNRSDLTFTCKVTADGSTSEGAAIEFPVLELNVRHRYYDYTDFDPDGESWNAWQKGPGAAHSSDLILKTGAVPGNPRGYYLFDYGNTNTSNPVTQREKLFKNYVELEQGRKYKFSAQIRDGSGVPNKPRLILVANGQDISAVTLPGTSWQLIEGVFEADSSTMRLSLDNLQMGVAPGNDFDVTQITVQEI